MTTIAQERPALKPVSVVWRWLKHPIWPCDLIAGGLPGVLEINGTPYSVLPLVPGGYRLVNLDNRKVYDIDTANEPWVCCCGDATFRSERPGGCKHRQALEAALRSLWGGVLAEVA